LTRSVSAGPQDGDDGGGGYDDGDGAYRKKKPHWMTVPGHGQPTALEPVAVGDWLGTEKQKALVQLPA